MKKLLAYVLCMMLVVTSLVLPVSAAENIAAEDSSSYLPMTTWLPFNNAAITEETAATDDEGISLWNSTVSAETIVLYEKPFGLSVIDRTKAAYNYTGDGAVKIFPTASNYTDFALEVDFTKNQVFDYVIASSYQNIYNTIATNGSAAYVDGATSLAGSVVSTTKKHGNSRYTLVVDSKAKTIQYYINGVWKYTSEPYTENSITLRLMVRATGGANKPANYSTMYYYTEYTQADTPGFQIVGTPTATQAVIQFNQPVGLSSLNGITVGGNAVTSAADVSVDYDEPNVYKLTYAELANGAKYTIDASSIIPLYNQETTVGGGYDTGAVVDFGTQEFTLGTVALAQRVSGKDNKLLYGSNLEFVVGGSSSITNASLEWDGTKNELIVQQGNEIANEETGQLTAATMEIRGESFGTRSDRVIVEHDIYPSTSMMYLKTTFGERTGGSNYITLKANGNKVGYAGTVHHYIYDFDFTPEDTETTVGVVKVYKDGVLENTVDITVKPANANYSKLCFYMSNIKGEDQTVPAQVKLADFSFYQPLTSSFGGQVVTLEDGTSVTRYSHSLKTVGAEGDTLTTATATPVGGGDAISVGMVKLQESENEINYYQIDTSSLAAGTYDVVVNPVSFEGASAAPLAYQLTVTGEPMIVNGLTLTKNEETSKMVATVNVTNNRNNSLPLTMILAKYSERGVLCDVDVYTLSAPVGTNDLSKTKTAEEGYTYKAFVWDNLSGITPLTAAK